MHATTLAQVVRRLYGGRCTVHGFRSSFRDWASEQTSVPHAVAEAALAHQVGSAVERSYARSDLFDKRRGGPGGRPRGAGGGDGADDLGRDASVRKLGTSNSSTTEWCTRRSIAAAVAIWSRKIRSHWLKTRLLVTITERRS